jgi:hypothetical protein
MAYMSQERKQALAPKIKAVLKKHGMKGSIGVRHHSTLVVRIKEGKLPLIEDFVAKIKHEGWDQRTRCTKAHEERMLQITQERHIDVNPYHFKDHFTGNCKEFLSELHAAMSAGNHDRSDILTDYFDIGWYVEMHIGDYDRPYKMVE